jgi:hypothetical protein
MKPIRLFISSVQKELELERAVVAGLIATDPFLLQHSVPVLFEKEPPPPRPDSKPYDLKGLTELGLLQQVGKGRAVRYVAKTTDNRPTQS